jgi:hypothetical protein
MAHRLTPLFNRDSGRSAQLDLLAGAIPNHWRPTEWVPLALPCTSARQVNRQRLPNCGGHGGSMRRRGTWVAIVCASVILTGCSGSTVAPAAGTNSRAGSSSAPAPTVARRFTVRLGPAAVSNAAAAGVDLSRVVDEALVRINALLPGPPTTINVRYSHQGLIPQLGVGGFTDPMTGAVSVWFGPRKSISLRQSLTLWLPQALAHEVNHSVRILAGPGFGVELGDQMVSEGVASAFDGVAFPGSPDPWDHALTRQQECRWWTKAKPLLDQLGLYNDWMFGGFGIPHLTGFDVGYQVVNQYRQDHPADSWKQLTTTPAATILSHSQYRPCGNNQGGR